MSGLWNDTSGASLGEYALALCVGGLATVFAIRLLAEPIGDAFLRSSSGMAAK